MTVYKTGRWSNEEISQTKDYIEQGLSYEQIEARINRPANTIKQMVEQKLMMNISDDAKLVIEVEYDIKNSPEWRELCKQIDIEEQNTFLHHWREIVAQFDNDVTHTEKLQIIDVVRTEILINRVLSKIHEYNQMIETNKLLHKLEMDKDFVERDPNQLIEFQKKIGDSMNAIGALNREYKDLCDRKSAILKEIKGTRDQRVKRIEESKETLTGFMAALISDIQLRSKLGLYMEKFRIAKDVEFERLSEYHTYEDGQVEQPLLSAESIKEDNY